MRGREASRSVVGIKLPRPRGLIWTRLWQGLGMQSSWGIRRWGGALVTMLWPQSRKEKFAEWMGEKTRTHLLKITGLDGCITSLHWKMFYGRQAVNWKWLIFYSVQSKHFDSIPRGCGIPDPSCCVSPTGRIIKVTLHTSTHLRSYVCNICM